MDSSAIRDISDDEGDLAPCPASTVARPESTARERAQRRFAFDATSSPVLVAALAWDTAVAH